MSFEVAQGEVLALVGESGCGKSVTALSLLRLVPKPGRIESGSIRIAGREVLSLPVSELRRVRGREAAMIFQEPMTSLSPVLTVGAQVVEALRLHERLGGGAGAPAHARAVRAGAASRTRTRASTAIPHQLSGGLKQRVMIAMALALRPRLLIADEPTTALDVTIQAQILELMRDLQRELGTAILLITHDLGVVNELADRIAVMYAGRLVEEGTREQVLGDARHPYTRGLLRAVPSLGRRGRAARRDRGGGAHAAGAARRAAASRRAARSRLPRCATDPPGDTQVAPGHVARCHVVAQELAR